MKNSEFNAADIKKVCETKLLIEFRDSKEFNGWYLYRGRRVARITVSKGKTFIPPKTYSSMARQLKLTTPQFDDLLTCPLTKPAYDRLLGLQGV